MELLLKRKAVTERQLRDGENQIALPLELVYKITCILPILYHKDYFLSSINLNFMKGAVCMSLPKGAVLTIGDVMPDGARYVSLCINRLTYGVYKAYLQRGGSCYKLYTMKGQRYLPPAPVTPFLVSVHEIVSGYAHY